MKWFVLHEKLNCPISLCLLVELRHWRKLTCIVDEVLVVNKTEE